MAECDFFVLLKNMEINGKMHYLSNEKHGRENYLMIVNPK